jgi:tetratricopeptide (TPR) repeat protein
MAMAERANDPPKLLTANFARGIDLAHLDELVTAREHLEKAVTIFGLEKRLPLDLELQRVVSLGYLALTLISLGYPDRGLARVREMLTIARRCNDPFILSNAFCVTPLAHLYRGDGTAMHEQADTLAALAEENGFSGLPQLAAGYRGAGLVLQGRLDEGVIELRRNICAMKTAGATPFGWAYRVLAYGLARAGRVQEGLQAVQEGLAAAAKPEEPHASPHLFYVKGLLLAQIPTAREQAEDYLRTAIDIARRQSARLSELLATTSLARLLAKQGRRDEARAMLAEIYGWFTEGFDTADLKDAKALLDQLNA